jgi:hypothetical protein
MNQLGGYMHPKYGDSLREFGEPVQLPRCGGSILERSIPGTTYHDAMGCYPLFVCNDWTQLSLDLEDMREKLVSLALVTDPFGKYDEVYLRQCFNDVVRVFKEHFIADLHRPLDSTVSSHHRYYARKAVRNLLLEECQEPARSIDEWVTLYANLVNRHNLKGVKAFSRETFAKQLSIPGTVMLRAMQQGVPVAAQVWFVQGDVAYSHLTAISEEGYAMRASYALYWFAMEFFSGKVRWLDFGAGAGVKSDGKDGLTRFKKGWSTGTRTAYFCGRIFDPEKYAEIVKVKGIGPTEYFPAYRKGEFG